MDARILQPFALDHLPRPCKNHHCLDCCDAHSTSEVGHELPRHLAERAAVIPSKAAAPSRDQGGRGGTNASFCAAKRQRAFSPITTAVFLDAAGDQLPN
jgi:hypothetical protein